MSQRIITGLLTRSIGATRWTPKQQSQWLSIRHSSNKPAPVSPREITNHIPTNRTTNGGDQFKIRPPPSLELPEFDSHMKEVRENVHSALKKDGIEVDKWPWLERFIDANIAQKGRMARDCLKKMYFDLAYKDPSSEGTSNLDPLYVQLSTESERIVFQITQILSSILPRIPVKVYQLLLARYYHVGLSFYVERLADVIVGSKIITARDRAVLLCVKLKYNVYEDYWEAFEEYRRLRDWCLKQGEKEIINISWWSRVVYALTKVQIQDTITSPSLPVDITLELLADHDKFARDEEADSNKLQCLFLDHYGKKASPLTSPEWILHHQQIIVGIHEALVERYGEDLNSNSFLFTSLLEAYGRVGLPQSAMEVWNRMITSDVGINSVALSVVFDNCGRLNRLSDARRIFAWLEHGERTDELMDKNVWDSWLECLCRCGALREAIHYAFHLMEPALRRRAEVVQEQGSTSFSRTSEGLSVLKPDAKTFKLLLSFSGSTKGRHSYGVREPAIHAEIQQRIKEEFPEATPSIQDFLLVIQAD
ncbi:uncharacterized protein FA14DRAFT_176211 [Meira miltonrushii]|uniref:Pentatricopeptide repeat protein n=1 Tax=Meira miltonrushii TaxID=1280837 RepID=A0A316VIM6_9BASI|nr:uncharacterized protein FA14DRAFT_176211 [Meira miltonrushii]PWN36908.1 hypothetical protein FA14DRAFT_176211 [Meira miltonrushii]